MAFSSPSASLGAVGPSLRRTGRDRNEPVSLPPGSVRPSLTSRQVVSVKMVEGKLKAFTLLSSSSSAALVSATAVTPYMVGTIEDIVAIVDDLSTLEGSTPVSAFDQIYYACSIVWDFPVDVLDTPESTKQAALLNVGLRELVVDSHLLSFTVKGQDLIDSFAMWHFVKRGAWPVQARPELAAFAALKFSKFADGSQDSSSFSPASDAPVDEAEFLSPACTPPSIEADCGKDAGASMDAGCVLLGSVEVNHPDPLVSGNYAPFVGRWLHEIAAEAAKQEPVPSGEGAVPSSPVFASRLSAMQSALIADFGSSAVMKDDFSVPAPSVVLPASSSRMSNVGDLSTEALSDSESGSVWDGSFPPCPGLDALVQNIPVIIDADGVVMPPVAAESSLHFDEDEVVRLSGVVSSLNGEADVGQSSLNSMSPAFSRSMSPSVLQQMKCEQNAAKIQELLQQAAAKRLVLSQGPRLLCGLRSSRSDRVEFDR